MATRSQRISEFSQGEPPAGETVELLCEDHAGTYLVPFGCRFVDGHWLGERGGPIAATVVGWRATRRS